MFVETLTSFVFKNAFWIVPVTLIITVIAVGLAAAAFNKAENTNSSVAVNSSKLTTNTASITENTSGIQTNETQIRNNSVNIATSNAAMAGVTQGLNNIVTQLGQNTANITTNQEVVAGITQGLNVDDTGTLVIKSQKQTVSSDTTKFKGGGYFQYHYSHTLELPTNQETRDITVIGKPVITFGPEVTNEKGQSAFRMKQHCIMAQSNFAEGELTTTMPGQHADAALDNVYDCSLTSDGKVSIVRSLTVEAPSLEGFTATPEGILLYHTPSTNAVETKHLSFYCMVEIWVPPYSATTEKYSMLSCVPTFPFATSTTI